MAHAMRWLWAWLTRVEGRYQTDLYNAALQYQYLPRCAEMPDHPVPFSHYPEREPHGVTFLRPVDPAEGMTLKNCEFIFDPFGYHTAQEPRRG